MNTNAKKILLTGTAFLAVSLAGIGAAHAAPQDLNVGGLTVTAGNVEGSNFSANVTADVANGSAAITGPITNTTTGHGTLNFLGGAVAVNGTVGVGGGGPISAITLGVAGSSTTFGAAVNAGSVTFSGNGSATFSGATTLTGTLALGTGSLIVGGANAVSANTITGTGTVTFTNGGTLGTSNGIAVNSMINTAGASTYNGIGTIGAVNVNGGSLTIGFGGASITGAATLGANTLSFGGSSIASVTGAGGTLNLTGSSPQAIAGTVGSAGAGALGTIALTGTGSKTFGAAVHTATMTTNASTVAGAGAITATNFTNVAGTTTVANALTATNINVQGGTLTLNGAVSGVTTVNMGSASGNPTSSLTTAMGAITNLNHLGGTSTVASATATNTGISGGGHMTLTAGNLGAVTFGAGGGQVTGAGITSIAGNAAFTDTGTVDSQVTGIAVTTTAGGTGTIVVSNAASTLSGASLAANTGLTFGGTTIGAVTGAGSTLTLNAAGTQTLAGVGAAGNALTVLTLDGSGTKNLNNEVFATTVNIDDGVAAEAVNGAHINGNVAFTGTGTGTLKLATTNVTGNITTAAANTGTVTFNGPSTIGGNIGAGNAIGTLNAITNNGAALTFNGTVNAQNLLVDDVTGAPDMTFNGATNAIANAVDFKTGTLTLGNNATMAIANGGVSGATLVVNGGTNTVTTNAASTSTITTVTKGNAGTATLTGGTYALTTVNVNAGTLNVEGAASTIGGTSTIVAASNLGFSGATIGPVEGAGTLQLVANTTALGAVGTVGQSLAAVDIGTGTKTFGANLYANTLSFSGAGTANLAATTTANAQAINFNNNAGTVQYGAGVTYTGTTSSTGGAAGTLVFGDNATLNGTIGTAPNKIGAVTLGGGANTISQSVFANTINLGTGTVVVASGLTLGGDVAASAATLNPVGALTVSGNLGRLTAMTLTGNTTVGGTAAAADTTNIGVHKLTVNGTSFETAGASTQMNFSVYNNVGGSGQVVATGAGTTLNVVAGTKVNVSVDTADVIVQGQEYVLIDGNEASASTIGATTLTTTNTALLHFKQKLVADGVSDGTKNLIVYADRTQMSSVTVDPNNGAVGKMLDSLGAGGDADVDALQVRLANFGVGQGAAVEQMLSTLTPDASGATVTTTANLGNTTSTIVNNRVGSVRAGSTFGSGESTGNGLDGKNFWGQAFGFSADQSRRGFAAGYDAESFGAVFGVDADVMENLRAGIAFAYANTDVSGEDSNRTSTNIDSYQVSLYADMNLSDDYFLSGQLAYMYNDMDTARHNVGGLAGNTARADFHSNQYTARGEVGRSFAVERGLSLTPSALVNYNYIDVSDFSEKGAGGLSLRNVKTDEMQILEFGVNLMAEMNLDDGHGGIVTPNLHGGYRYDVIGDDVATSAALAGGGAAFKTQGADAAQGTGNIGTGVKWSTASNLDLSVNYDFEAKSDYKAHSGFVRAGYKF